MPKVRFQILSILLSALLPICTANADEYASAAQARDAAIKAMKDFQVASANCKDITNPRNNLSPTEFAGIKIILERSKTLFDDCAVPDIFSEQSVKQLASDTGATPAKSISEYSDYVMEFEAYSSSIESVVDDINEALPALKSLGKLLAERQNEISLFEKNILKFENAYASYSTESKNLISANPAWNTYQNFKTTLNTEKENYIKAIANIDELNRLVDLDSTLDEVSALFKVIVPLSDLDKSINEMSALVVSKSNSTTSKSSTITCVKGKTIKKVTAVNPKCPTGYKKK